MNEYIINVTRNSRKVHTLRVIHLDSAFRPENNDGH